MQNRRTIEFLANDSRKSIEMKKSFKDKGYKINHIYSGSSKPIAMEEGMFIVGAGNIRAYYNLSS